MNEPAEALRIEPRWPVLLAVLGVLLLLFWLPERVKLFPVWLPYATGVAVLVPMVGVALARAKEGWLRVERAIVLLFFVSAGAGNFLALVYLIRAIVGRTAAELGGFQLLTSSVGVWVTNVLLFSLLYWQLDRGGPEARANGAGAKPDWLFPQAGAPEEVAPDWRPTFVDYLFLGFSTATAFSPTQDLPLTGRAKLLMMLQSSISLLTLVVVASRAINVLGS